MNDTISRQDAIKELSHMMDIDGFRDGWAVSRSNVDSMLRSLPSVQPRSGKWIIINKFEDCCYAKCNQCNVTQVFYYNKPLTNFCPNCGAKLEGDQDG